MTDFSSLAPEPTNATSFMPAPPSLKPAQAKPVAAPTNTQPPQLRVSDTLSDDVKPGSTPAPSVQPAATQTAQQQPMQQQIASPTQTGRQLTVADTLGDDVKPGSTVVPSAAKPGAKPGAAPAKPGAPPKPGEQPGMFDWLTEHHEEGTLFRDKNEKLSVTDLDEAENRAFVSGIPFGTYTDEAHSALKGMAALMTGGSYGQTYEADQQRIKKLKDVYNSEHPIASTLRTLGGAAASMPFTPELKFVKGLNWAGRSAVGALENGAFGFAQGFGEGDTLDERLHNAYMGGAFGMVAGTVFPPLGKLISNPATRMAAGGAIGAGIAEYEDPLGSGITGRLEEGGAGFAMGAGAMSATNRIGNAKEFAAEYLGNALKRDKVSLEDARHALQKKGATISGLGADAVIEAGQVAAISGEGRRLGALMYKDQRGAYEGEMAEAVNHMISDQSFYGAVESLDKGMRISSRPLYKVAYEKADSQGPMLNQRSEAFAETGRVAHEAEGAVHDAERELTQAQAKLHRAGDNVYGVNSANEEIRAATKKLEKAQTAHRQASQELDSVRTSMQQSQADIAAGKRVGFTTPHLERIAQDRFAKAGLAEWLDIEERNAVADNVPFDPKEWGITGKDANGMPTYGKVNSLRMWDAMVKGLDRELDRNRNDFGVLHDNTHVDSLLNLRRALRRELDLYAPPEYAQAREAWSGPSAVKEAIGQGRDFSTKDPEEIAAYVKRMKPAVRDGYKIGVARWWADMIATGKRGPLNAADKMVTTKMKQRLQAALGDDAAVERLVEKAQGELEKEYRGQRFLRGSDTAARNAAKEDFDASHPIIEHAVQGGRHTFSGLATGVHQHLGRMGSKWLWAQMKGMSARKQEELGKLMFSTDREQNLKYIEKLYEETKKNPVQPLSPWFDPAPAATAGFAGQAQRPKDYSSLVLPLEPIDMNAVMNDQTPDPPDPDAQSDFDAQMEAGLAQQQSDPDQQQPQP